MSKRKTTRKITKLTTKQVEKHLDLIRRRAYWREVGETLLLGIYQPEGFFNMDTRANPFARDPGKPLTLGEVLDRLPAEVKEKVMGLDVEWLIGLLAPRTGDTGWRDNVGEPHIEVIMRPDQRQSGGNQANDRDGVEVSPPRILVEEAKPKAKKKAKAKTGSKKKGAKKKGSSKKPTTSKNKAPTPKKKTAKKAPKKTSPKKKASTKPKGEPRKRRTMVDLQESIAANPKMASTEPGLTRAEIRASLECSGDQVKRLLEGLVMKGRLVVHGENRNARYRFIVGNPDSQASLPNVPPDAANDASTAAE